MAWARKRLKNGKIYAEVDDDGKLIANEKGLVRYRYKPDDDRDYTTHRDKIRDLDGATPEVVSAPAPPRPAPSSPAAQAGPLRVSAVNAPSPIDELEPPNPDHIEVFTDGACTGNPGPAGLGVVLRFGPWHRELYQYLGLATNNIAELMAIKVALEAIRDPSRPVRLHTDSQYAIGVLAGGFKAKANKELIQEIQRLMKRFPDLKILKVAGHAGVPLNERVDELARQAVQEGLGGGEGAP